MRLSRNTDCSVPFSENAQHRNENASVFSMARCVLHLDPFNFWLGKKKPQIFPVLSHRSCLVECFSMTFSSFTVERGNPPIYSKLDHGDCYTEIMTEPWSLCQHEIQNPTLLPIECQMKKPICSHCWSVNSMLGCKSPSASSLEEQFTGAVNCQGLRLNVAFLHFEEYVLGTGFQLQLPLPGHPLGRCSNDSLSWNLPVPPLYLEQLCGNILVETLHLITSCLVGSQSKSRQSPFSRV